MRSWIYIGNPLKDTPIAVARDILVVVSLRSRATHLPNSFRRGLNRQQQQALVYYHESPLGSNCLELPSE